MPSDPGGLGGAGSMSTCVANPTSTRRADGLPNDLLQWSRCPLTWFDIYWPLSLPRSLSSTCETKIPSSLPCPLGCPRRDAKWGLTVEGKTWFPGQEPRPVSRHYHPGEMPSLSLGSSCFMKRRGPGIVLDGAVTLKVEPGECRTPNPIPRGNSGVGMTLGGTSRTRRRGAG